MDNVARYGFRWFKGAGGTPFPQPISMEVADSYQAQNDASAMNVGLTVGDPVKLVAATGTVALANTTDNPYGVIVGVERVYNAGLGVVHPTDYVPGATTGGGLVERQTRVLVVPFSWGIWEIDVDDAVTATTYLTYRALIGENAPFTCVGDNTDASRPVAKPRLDISLHDTTATLEMRIVGISPTRYNRDFSGANVKLLVQANITTEPGAAATPHVGI